MAEDLAILALESARTFSGRVNEILTEWNGGGPYLVSVECPRFGSGEG